MPGVAQLETSRHFIAMKGSATINWLLLAVWCVAALLLVRTRWRGRWVFLVSCIAAIPFLIYDSYRFGLPEMGGILHLFSFGCMPLILRWAIRRRWYRLQTDHKNGV